MRFSRRGPRLRPPGKSPRRSLLLWAAGMALPLLVFLLVLPTFYYSVSPGSAEAVEPIISVEGRSGLQEGHLFLTSVSLDQLPLMGLLAQALDGARLETLRDLVGEGGSLQDYNRRSDLLMRLSKETATAVALREAGYQVDMVKAGVLVLGLSPDAPASSQLQVGDALVELDGMPVEDSEVLRSILAGKRPGDPVTLVVEREAMDEEEAGDEGASRIEMETTLTSLPGDSAAAALGVIIRDRVLYRFPLEVKIETEGLTGPSAGLMLALGIINVLEEGALVSEGRVAGTGEIFPDGSVGPIGGIDMKIKAAAAAGATLFLAPRDNYEEIGDRPPGMRIVAVGDIGEALQAIRESRSP